MPELAAACSHAFKTLNCIVYSLKKKTKTQEKFLSLLTCIEGSCVCFMLRKSYCLFTADGLASIRYHVNLVHLVKLVVKLIQKLYVDIPGRAKKLVLLLSVQSCALVATGSCILCFFLLF